MDHPFPKSTSSAEKVRRLLDVVSPSDTLGIVIDADPDAMASALALKRIFWRRIRKTSVYRINRIRRADNLAFVELLKVAQEPVRDARRSKTTRWAIVDGQPEHRAEFRDFRFDIIIDHHPVLESSTAAFVDIREDYGASSTILTEYLRAAGIAPSSRLATALFYGIKTDTSDFVRQCHENDLKAFRYLHRPANMNIIRKLESSEMTRRTLATFRTAMERLAFLDGVAYVHMGKVDSGDTLVIIADFFMQIAEARWSIVSGVREGKLLVVLRTVGLSGHAGKSARKLFGTFGGSVGGRTTAARAEIPLSSLRGETSGRSGLERFIKRRIRELLHDG